MVGTGFDRATVNRSRLILAKNFGGYSLMTPGPFGKSSVVGGAVARPEIIVANGGAGMRGGDHWVCR